MIKFHVDLSEQDKNHLLELLEKGSLKSRIFKRITGLLELNKGKTYRAVKEIANLSVNSLRALAARYAEQGLDCLHDKPRSGRPITITKIHKDEVTKLACTTPPDGHEYWSVRLLADKIVELKLCDKMSYGSVHNILQKKT